MTGQHKKLTRQRREQREKVHSQRDRTLREKLRSLREAMSKCGRSSKEIEALVRQYETRLRSKP
jgi:hypothetical protein